MTKKSSPVIDSSEWSLAEIEPDAASDEVFQAKDFFLARQPILDREQGLVGYELLFRSAASVPANVSDDVAATAAVIAHAAELGINNVIGNMPGIGGQVLAVLALVGKKLTASALPALLSVT